MTVMRKIGCLALSGALLLSGFVFSGCDPGAQGLFPEEGKATLTSCGAATKLSRIPKR